MKKSIKPQRGFYPQPAYLIGTYKDNHVPNFALITQITNCSVNPPTIMFFTRGNNITHKLIDEKKVFSANMVNEDLLIFADFCGINSGENINKLEEWNYKIDSGKVLDVPIIDVSPFVYECEFIDKFKIGDGIIYIGEIRNIQIDSSIKKTEYGEINLMDFKPVIYAPSKYYSLMRSLGKVGLSRGRTASKNA